MDDFVDARPEFRATQVIFYDQVGHLVSFDFDPMLLQNGLEIYLSGYLKCLTDDTPLGDDGIPVTQIGPVVEWWISGYGNEEHIVLGVSTETAHYYLTAPNEEYTDIFNKVMEKAYLSKVSAFRGDATGWAGLAFAHPVSQRSEAKYPSKFQNSCSVYAPNVGVVKI